MGQKLVITLTEEATEKYFELARAQTAAELDEDCEPSDVWLTICIAASNLYESTAILKNTEIGEVSVDLIESE